jgi:LacI family repressor for deo operon, udp, cdd, tsx, nupC, and nupG
MATLDAMEVPWVTINHATARTSHNFVTADFPGAGRHVGWCFAKLGYERVMLLGVPLASSTSWSELVGGFTQGYLVGGMNFPGMVHVECEADNGAAVFAAVSERLKGHAAPKGIFAFGDLTSLEAIRACREVGLRVPQDVAVVGATGLEMSRYTDPPLSTIAQPLERIGYEAVNLLIEVARLGTRRIPGRVISAPLILRASVHVPDELKQVLREKVDLADSDDYDAVHSS